MAPAFSHSVWYFVLLFVPMLMMSTAVRRQRKQEREVIVGIENMIQKHFVIVDIINNGNINEEEGAIVHYNRRNLLPTAKVSTDKDANPVKQYLGKNQKLRFCLYQIVQNFNTTVRGNFVHYVDVNPLFDKNFASSAVKNVAGRGDAEWYYSYSKYYGIGTWKIIANSNLKFQPNEDFMETSNTLVVNKKWEQTIPNGGKETYTVCAPRNT